MIQHLKYDNSVTPKKFALNFARLFHRVLSLNVLFWLKLLYVYEINIKQKISKGINE